MNNNLVELAKALKLIQETCDSISSKECDNMRELGNCPIYKILGDCTIGEVPADWSIKEEFSNENK
nr:MAG TPA: hypothetical protein [Caudoviricetes sp.]